MNFKDLYYLNEAPLAIDPNNWKERRVMHMTPTGQKNRIKIKYLPLKDQERYKPTYIKQLEIQKKQNAEELDGRDTTNMEVRLGQGDGKKISTNPLDHVNNNINNHKPSSHKRKHKKKVIQQQPSTGEYIDDSLLMDFYYAVEDPDKFNVVYDDKTIEATIKASNTTEWEEQGLYICEALRVPMEAIVAYKNKKDKWVHFKNKIEDEKKNNFIKFNEIEWVKLNLIDSLDIVKFNLLTDSDGERSK